MVVQAGTIGGAAAVGAGQPLEREAALAAIAGLVDGVRAGRGTALFLEGEAGLGKTTCVSHAIAMATPGIHVGLGRGDVMETSLPFGLFAAALGAVGCQDLCTSPAAGARLGDLRAARFHGVLRELQDVTKPVLLALDDLHWADPDSLALLSFLCRRLAGLPVGVVGTLRPWPPAAHELVSALGCDGDASVQQLAPLSEDAAAMLLAARLGGAGSAAASRATARLCAGNPLLLEQVAASISQGGQAQRLMSAGTAIGLEGIVLTRFAGLPPAALRVARAASVLGTRFRPALATELAGLPDRQAEAALEALCRSGLVRAEQETAATFVHPLFCQSLYHDMAVPIRAQLHARAFVVLSEHGLEAEAVQHALRADLVGDPVAIAAVERSGRAALAAGAVDSAAEFLQAAVRLAGDRSGSTLLLALGEALLIAGRPGAAIEVYERLHRRDDVGITERVQTLRMMGRALFATGAHDHASRRYGEAAALAKGCGDAVVAEVLLGEAAAFMFVLGPAHSLPLAARAQELTATACRPLRRYATGMWGLAAVFHGDLAGLAACDTVARELMSGSPEPSELAWRFGPLGAFAVASVFTEHFADAEDALDTVLTAAERAGALEATATHLIIKAVLLTRQGRLADALVAADQAAAWAELMPYCEAPAGCAKAEIQLLMGRLVEGSDFCQRIEAIAADRGQSDALLRLWHVRARLRHHAGDHPGACALYERIERLSAQMGIGEPCAVPWARHALIAYLASDRPDDARRVIEWLEHSGAGLPCRWPRIAAATGRAALAEAGGDPDAADQQYQVALILHEQVELPVEHVETLLGYGRFLRRRGQPVRARSPLAEALVIAEKCEASWLADQVRAELAIAGGRRRCAREDPTRLTAQEQRVARLAAAGHSNKAIAGQLCLSARTIESHLAQVYTKLGITSRRQLMAGHHDI